MNPVNLLILLGRCSPQAFRQAAFLKVCPQRWRGLCLAIGLGFWLVSCSTSIPASSSPTAETAVLEPGAASTPTAPALESSISSKNQVGLGQVLPITAQAEIGDQIIQLEVAETPQQQRLGLMYRTELAANRGMLFPFDPPIRARFWMKNVPISLDMIFLYQGAVVAIAADAPPCTENPCPVYGPENRDQLVDQVIELRGGRAAEIGLQVGDLITINPLDPAASVAE